MRLWKRLAAGWSVMCGKSYAVQAFIYVSETMQVEFLPSLEELEVTVRALDVTPISATQDALITQNKLKFTLNSSGKFIYRVHS